MPRLTSAIRLTTGTAPELLWRSGVACLQVSGSRPSRWGSGSASFVASHARCIHQGHPQRMPSCG